MAVRILTRTDIYVLYLFFCAHAVSDISRVLWPACDWCSASPFLLFFSPPLARAQVDQEKLAALKARSAAVRTGGKGSVRRKVRAPRAAAGTDEKTLQATLKRLGATPANDVGIVALVRGDDEDFLAFRRPRLLLNQAANLYAVTGKAEERPYGELIGLVGGAAAAAAHARMQAEEDAEDSDDDDVPELVEAEDFQKEATKTE
jgi:nascent polypeptide-associated complex subunit beta